MKLIISPAKTMKLSSGWTGALTRPVFLSKTERLRDIIRGLSYDEQKKLWKCNDKIAQLNRERFEKMDLGTGLTPAVIAYDGIQYNHISPLSMSADQTGYLQEHLCILSAFYGALKPFDGIVQYRLEMNTRSDIFGKSGLYGFWEDKIYREVIPQDRTIINLASKEYSKCIEKHLRPDDLFITVSFAEKQGNRFINKSVYAKIARGEMVKYLSSVNASAPEQIKSFEDDGYSFSEKDWDKTSFVFVRERNE